MPKARRRYTVPGRTTIGPTSTANSEAAQRPPIASPRLTSRRATPAQGAQSLFWPVMVMLGCWGLAYTMLFYSTDPNRYIFGGMAILMALLWAFIIGLRVRKLRQVRQRGVNR